MTDKPTHTSAPRKAPKVKPDEPHLMADLGGPIDEMSISFCIYGDDLDPDQISQILGVSPTHAYREGEHRLSRAERARHPVPSASAAWILRVRDQSPRQPGELTKELLDQLPDDEALWDQLASRYHVRLSYGLFVVDWSSGFSLSPELVARIARMRAVVEFDIYADLGDEEG